MREIRKVREIFKKLAAPTLGVLWATLYFWEVRDKAANVQLLIRPAYFAALVLYVALTIRAVRDWRAKTPRGADAANAANGGVRDVAALAACLFATALYLVAMHLLGFALPTGVFLFLCFSCLGATRLRAFFVSVALVCVLYAVFELGLVVSLPRGVLWG